MIDPDGDDSGRVGRPELENRVLAEYGWIRRLAAHLLPSGPDADDVTQEVVAAALDRRPRIDPGKGLRRWLDRVTRRQASLWQARRQRRRRVEAEARAAADSGDRAPDPPEVIERLEMHRALTAAVLDLPEPYRSVVVARFLDGRSVADIAAERGIRRATVRQQLTRAIGRLRERLRRERGAGWKAGVALLALGRKPTPAAPPSGATTLPGPTTLSAALLTMKTLATALVATVALLVWWSWPTPDALRSLTIADPDTPPDAPSQGPATGAAQHVERTTVSPDASGPATAAFVLRVVDFNGTPLPDVTVALVPDRPHLISADIGLRATDHAGRVELEAHPGEEEGVGPHRLVVAAPSRLPEWQPFEVPGAGAERVCRYGGPGTVWGSVVPVGDEAALGSERNARPRWLRSAEHRTAVLRELPQPVVDVFRRRGLFERLQGMAPVDPDTGAFAFHGLPDADSTIRVELPLRSPFVVHPAHTFAESSSRKSVVLRAGRTDQVVAVVPVPALRLRAVFGDGTPAAHAHLDFRPFLVDDDGPLCSANADAGGVFLLGLDLESLPLHRFLDPADQARVMRVEVFGIHHPAAETSRKFTFQMPPDVRWADAGEVVLHRLDTLHVLAVDRDGARVRGAVFDGTRRSPPTGNDGRTVVRTRDATLRAFRIGAHGMLVDRYTASEGRGTEDDPLRFELAPENRVEFQLVSGELRAQDVILELEGPEDLFHSVVERWKEIPSHLHRTAGTGDIRHGRGRVRRARFDDDLSFTLVSVEPGAPITATVLDELGSPIADAETVTPPFGETEHVRLEPGATICRIDGRVLTADGTPARARLRVGGRHMRGNRIFRARTSTDDDGRFHLRLVATGRDVPVRVTSDGHAILRTRLRLVDGQPRPVLTLHTGHSIVAALVDDRGSILDREIEVADPGIGAVTQRLHDKRTRISRLPDRPVTLRAGYGGRTFTERIDPENVDGPVLIRAPEPERIPLRVAGHVDEDAVLQLRIVSSHDKDDRIRTQLHRVDGTWQPSELPIYPGEYHVRCYGNPGPSTWETVWTITEGDTGPRWLCR